MSIITYGYYINNDEKKDNDIVLREAIEKIKREETIEKIKLKKL